MKRIIAILGAFCLVMAFSMPAAAEVNVFADIFKDKDVDVDIDANIFKDIHLLVKQALSPSNSVEAESVKNDHTQGNTITEAAFPFDTASFEQLAKEAYLDGDVFLNAVGIMNINLAPGSINNQGNAVAVGYSGRRVAVALNEDYSAADPYRFIGGVFLHAEASAEKELDGNTSIATYSLRSNSIEAAFNEISGILGINMAAGNLNNQNNAAALSVGDGTAVLAEADLGMINTNGLSTEIGNYTSDYISCAAFTNVAGIIGVNMSSGVLNNQANVVAASMTLFAPTAPTP